MKLYRTIFLTLFICLLFTQNSYAINEKKDDIRKNGKVEFTNEIHSIFSLKDCINIAIENNPQIRSAIYNEEAYKSKIGQAWASFFPRLSAGYSYSGNSIPFRNMSMSYTMGYVPSISADMLIFDFGKTKAGADMAKRMFESTQQNTKESINSVIYNIKSTYYNILFAQAQVKVYEDTVKDYELQLSQASAFYQIGKKAKAKLNLVKAKNVLEVAYVQLSQIMGIPEYTNYELSDELTLNNYEESFENLIKIAYDVRPELLSAQKTADAAKMNLRAKRRNIAPDLGIFGSYSNGIGNEYNEHSGQFGVGLNYTELNLMRVKKQIDEAKANYNKALSDYENIKNLVYLNVKKNYLELQTAKEAIIIAKLALDEAKEQYRQVTGRYKAGVGDAIELKDGENTYLNARLDFYNAMLNYNTTAASLEKEIGVPIVFSDKNILDTKN